jgi:hypothetical protein
LRRSPGITRLSQSAPEHSGWSQHRERGAARTPGTKSGTVTTSLRVPYTDTAFANWTNEWVDVSGSIHVVSQVTETDQCETGSECLSMEIRTNAQGVSGTGLTSGARYVGVDAEVVSRQLVRVSDEVQRVLNQIELMTLCQTGEQNDAKDRSERDQAILNNLQVTLDQYRQTSSAALRLCH